MAIVNINNLSLDYFPQVNKLLTEEREIVAITLITEIKERIKSVLKNCFWENNSVQEEQLLISKAQVLIPLVEDKNKLYFFLKKIFEKSFQQLYQQSICLGKLERSLQVNIIGFLEEMFNQIHWIKRKKVLKEIGC